MTAFTASNGATNYWDNYTGGSTIATLDSYAISQWFPPNHPNHPNYVVGAVTTRKTFTYNPDGTLASIDQAVLP